MKNIRFIITVLMFIGAASGSLFGMDTEKPTGEKPAYEGKFTISEAPIVLVSKFYLDRKFGWSEMIGRDLGCPIIPGKFIIKCGKNNDLCLWNTDKESSNLPDEVKKKFAPHGIPLNKILDKVGNSMSEGNSFSLEWPEFVLNLTYRQGKNDFDFIAVVGRFNAFKKQPQLADESWMKNMSGCENITLKQKLIDAEVIDEDENNTIIHGEKSWLKEQCLGWVTLSQEPAKVHRYDNGKLICKTYITCCPDDIRKVQNMLQGKIVENYLGQCIEVDVLDAWLEELSNYGSTELGYGEAGRVKLIVDDWRRQSFAQEWNNKKAGNYDWIKKPQFILGITALCLTGLVLYKKFPQFTYYLSEFLKKSFRF